MKLSQLINYRNLLQQLSSTSSLQTVRQELDKVIYLANNQPGDMEQFPAKLQLRYDDIVGAFANFEQDLTQFKSVVHDTITQLEKPWFAESYRLYDEEMGGETIDDIRNRKPMIPTEVEQFFHGRVTRYQGWQHPAMIIRPGFENYINSMVACDPLYLVDVKHELLTPTLEQYNNVYQNRLRVYVVNEKEDQSILTRLPDQQFGLVLVYNYFNFRPFELIRRYLNEIFVKLRPGGMLLMTINDCDRDKGVDLVERHFCCYTPGYLVEELVKSIGYEIEFKWHNDGPSTWLELRRPGRLFTLRGGQALAKIIPK